MSEDIKILQETIERYRQRVKYLEDQLKMINLQEENDRLRMALSDRDPDWDYYD